MRIVSLAMLAGLVAAAPASAQIWDGGGSTPTLMPRGLPGVGRSLVELDRTIREARRDGRLDRHEARQLRRENRQIGTLERRYRSGGLSASEQAELEMRAEGLRSLVNARRIGR